MQTKMSRKRTGWRLFWVAAIVALLVADIYLADTVSSPAQAGNNELNIGALSVSGLSSFLDETNATTNDSASSAANLLLPVQNALNKAVTNVAAGSIAQTIQKTLPYSTAPVTPITFKGKGTVEDGHFYSPILNRNEIYRIYLPPNYARSGQRYPVLYMLHGLSGSYLEWLDYKLFDTVDSLISQGKIKPIIIVLPSGDQEYWVDHANGGLQWGEYVAHDVVGYIDLNYRTIANRNNRAIGGHSMGGHGALQLAFNHPEVFSVVGAHSPTLRSKDQAPAYFGDEAFYEAHDPVSLAKSLPDATLKSLKIWVDIGTQDNEWRPRAEELNQVLTARGIPHQWNEWEGGHAGDYWISHVSQYLQFYANNLAGK